jgi:nucleoside-diphosphate kinase
MTERTLIIIKPDAVQRPLIGETSGNEATPVTLRGDFGGCRGYNLVHGSDAFETAEYEIGLYLKPEEIVDYQLANENGFYGSNV